MTAPALRIANCSGFYGDRLSAMREQLEGGEVDVVTGDYLAELTMLILGKARMKDADKGWATTFLRQLQDCLALALERGVKVVSNAGGLNPQGLRAAVEALGLGARVATVSGDDVLGRDVGVPGDLLTANAYLGCWGVVRALEAGADVVVTGRVTDASLVVGPAAWHHGWTRDDLDALAGATVAGHVLECGTQATGGNFSLFTDLPEGAVDRPAFPLAEVDADGSFVVTKHEGTGGAVTVATVTEQLLYELTGTRYGGPDVVTRFDDLRLEQQGPDRVRVTGARGLAPSGRLKVATNRLGGFRNTMVLPLVGLHVEQKAALLQRQLAPVLEGIAEVDVALARTDRPDADVQEEAAALLRVTVKDPDSAKVGRGFTAPVVELGLASIPGFHSTAAPPAPSAYGVYAPGWVDAADVPAVVGLPDGTTVEVAHAPPSRTPVDDGAAPEAPPLPAGPTRRVPLGTVAGARSGDKGGAATLGVYGRDDATYAWLAATLTPERLQELLPETAPLVVTRELLPTLRAVLFQVEGVLGEGAASGTRFDAQAKSIGEWLRSRVVDVPEALLA